MNTIYATPFKPAVFKGNIVPAGNRSNFQQPVDTVTLRFSAQDNPNLALGRPIVTAVRAQYSHTKWIPDHPKIIPGMTDHRAELIESRSRIHPYPTADLEIFKTYNETYNKTLMAGETPLPPPDVYCQWDEAYLSLILAEPEQLKLAGSFESVLLAKAFAEKLPELEAVPIVGVNFFENNYAVAVLGLPDGADIKDMNTWGDAVVIDVLGDRVLTVREAIQIFSQEFGTDQPPKTYFTPNDIPRVNALAV